MHLYLRKHFWLLGVITLMVCAVTAARAANHAVETWIASEPRSSVTPRSRPVAPRSKDGQALAARNMFCSDCDSSEVGALTRARLDLRLIATSVSTRPTNSFATIEQLSTQVLGAYAIGDSIPGAGVVTRIQASYVEVTRAAGPPERIELATSSPAPASPNLPHAPETGITTRSDGSFDIPRALVNRLLENPVGLAGQVRIVSSIRNGQPNGFKLYAIRPDSVFAQIGLQNGDTLTAINGMELTTADRVMEIYGKARDASNLTVELLRRGKPLTLRYTITEN